MRHIETGREKEQNGNNLKTKKKQLRQTLKCTEMCNIPAH